MPIDIPAEALALYDAANLALKAKLRRPSVVAASATTPSTPALSIKSVSDQSAGDSQHSAEAVDPKSVWFSRLSPSEQRKELRRLVGLSRLGLNDDSVAATMRKALQRNGR